MNRDTSFPFSPSKSQSRPSARRWAGVGVVALALFACTFRFEAALMQGELDPSWVFALNYFFDKGIIVGAEEVFTYGPLGFVVYPQAVGQNLAIALALAVAVQLAAALALASCVFRQGRGWAHA